MSPEQKLRTSLLKLGGQASSLSTLPTVVLFTNFCRSIFSTLYTQARSFYTRPLRSQIRPFQKGYLNVFTHFPQSLLKLRAYLYFINTVIDKHLSSGGLVEGNI